MSLIVTCYVFRGLESGLKCNDLLTNFSGLSAEEEANKYCTCTCNCDLSYYCYL